MDWTTETMQARSRFVVRACAALVNRCAVLLGGPAATPNINMLYYASPWSV